MYYKKVKVNSLENKELRKALRRKMTTAEAALWNMMRGKKLGGYKFRRQQGIGPYILDFYCPEVKLCIELDGSSHDYKFEYDEQRDLYLLEQGIVVLRFTNEHIWNNIDWVVAEILRVANDIAPRP